MEGAEQMRHLMDAFASIDWWLLRPAPELLAEQPGEEDVHDHILISKSEASDLAVAYTPQGKPVKVKMTDLKPGLRALWYNPRDGEPAAAEADEQEGVRVYSPPGEGDWLLVMA